jgi:hypothetical protein
MIIGDRDSGKNDLDPRELSLFAVRVADVSTVISYLSNITNSDDKKRFSLCQVQSSQHKVDARNVNKPLSTADGKYGGSSISAACQQNSKLLFLPSSFLPLPTPSPILENK